MQISNDLRKRMPLTRAWLVVERVPVSTSSLPLTSDDLLDPAEPRRFHSTNELANVNLV